MTDWCILRCAGSSTLNLASSLNEAGIEAWTPIGLEYRRVRRGEKREQVRAPIIPTFVFAGSAHLGDLVEISRSPGMLYRRWNREQQRVVVHGIPTFTLFRYDGAFPCLAERELMALRAAERRVKPKTEARPWALGDECRVMDAGFEGLAGTVIKVKGPYAWVLFRGFGIPVKISTWVLLPPIDAHPAVHVNARKSEQAQSAKAA